jgi:hypothetical protein
MEIQQAFDFSTFYSIFKLTLVSGCIWFHLHAAGFVALFIQSKDGLNLALPDANGATIGQHYGKLLKAPLKGQI